MTLATALLLAGISISSSQLGQFFTLPSGCPTTVSGRWTPGSDEWFGSSYWKRVTPEVISAVNSSFEAYYERVYHTGGFWSWHTMRDFEPGAWGYFDYSPTNRVVSRRLMEYDNVRNLISEMRTDWRNLTGDGSWGEGVAHPVTSTTANFATGVRCEMPTTRDWSQLADWNPTKLMITFNNVAGDALFSGIGRNWSPLFDALLKLRIYPAEDLAVLTNRATFAIADMMTANFSSYSITDATNVYRRLVNMPQALEPINQMLALSDRTIYRPEAEFEVYGDTTIKESIVAVDDVAAIDVTVTIDHGQITMPNISASDITWSVSGLETNVIAAGTYSPKRYLRVPANTFAGNNDLSITTNILLAVYNITAEHIANALHNSGVPNGRVEIWVDEYGGEYGFTADNRLGYSVGIWAHLPTRDPVHADIVRPDSEWQTVPSQLQMHGSCKVSGAWNFTIEHNFDSDPYYSISDFTDFTSISRVSESKFAIYQTIAYTNGSDQISIGSTATARKCLTRCNVKNGVSGGEDIRNYAYSASAAAKDKLQSLANSYIGFNVFNPPVGARISKLREWAHSTGGMTSTNRIHMGVSPRLNRMMGTFNSDNTFTPDDPSLLPLQDGVVFILALGYFRGSTPFDPAGKLWSGYADLTSLFWIDWDWQALQPTTY